MYLMESVDKLHFADFKYKLNFPKISEEIVRQFIQSMAVRMFQSWVKICISFKLFM